MLRVASPSNVVLKTTLAPYSVLLTGVSQGLLFQSLSLTRSLVDIFPGREHLLYSPMLKLWSWNVACIHRMKLRLPHSPVDTEKAHSSANRLNRGSRGLGLIKIARTPTPPGIAIATFRVLRYGQRQSRAADEEGVIEG